MKQSLHRSLPVFLALFLGWPSLVSAAGRDEAEIKAVLKAQAAAWNRGDSDGYMAGYARNKDTEFVGGDTLTRGWQTVRDRYRKKYDTREKIGRLTFSDTKVTLLGADAALVTGRWKLARKSEPPTVVLPLFSANERTAGASCTTTARPRIKPVAAA